jgi:hypothetical protein
MSARVKSFIFGLIVGGIIAFWAGANYGRGAPLWSNPFAERNLSGEIKEKAGEIAEGAREKLHEATKPPETPETPKQ